MWFLKDNQEGGSMRVKAMVLLLAAVAMCSVIGCAKKSASEQLRDDMRKASNQLNKDVNNLLK